MHGPISEPPSGTQVGTALRTSRYRVSGMDCGSCAAKIETALRRVPGIREVRVSVSAGTVSVSHEDRLGADAVVRPLSALGYGATPADAVAEAGASTCGGDCCGAEAHAHPHAHSNGHSHNHSHSHDDASEAPWWRGRKALLTVTAGVALAAATALGLLVPAAEPWAFPLALMVGLLPVARRALAAARAGTPFSIEMLMTVAAVGALLIGAVEEAATVLVLFLIGELLEGVAAGRARAGIRGLTALVPDTALLERDGAVPHLVPAAGLAVGSVILVRPGDRVAADGVVLSGRSSVDESPVTGESVPKLKREGDAVFAGTINADGALRVRVTAAARNNTIARIVRLVEEAQASKASTERLIDRFARFYTPGIVGVAILVAVLPPLAFGGDWTGWIYRALAVLLIGCPCALVISTPAAIAAGLSNGARRGLLLKGGGVLEALGRITTVAFDKTGTLTEGKPRVTDLVPFGAGEVELLADAAALEAGSSHPLARAILAAAAECGIAPSAADEVTALPGAGLNGRVEGRPVALLSPQAAGPALTVAQAEQAAAFAEAGKTVSVLLVDGIPAGLIAMRDELRSDARSGIAALERAGIRSLMMTGDNARTAGAVAGMLGMAAHAELLPDDKLRIVRDLQAQGQRVAKVGDGINDAPALAAADVGIAMGGGTDVALETADAAILHGRVGDVAAMVALSRRTMANIRQNIALALGLKAIFLLTTVLGVTGLWPAILADTGATVLVTANALRLLSVRL
ncbi:Cd2+/Zn2+-exporting ATPase [Azospirillum lipoferum]|uniref:P-type Zn(2+) transporter n=1 Tax=Azospirillum lipoferum TaxID=193 RepID=A0A5A9GHK9_AZOLI|nr:MULTISPECIES: heavy metal translocating P-type ATPase [Azospirillum]KAA0593826.1 cadmium-translocating P-type ATPase [Azospirillum lipoferum]MCP1614108.1 Cd2+/Zn2+-exporting ATPase [Azospirillum lipoferum]MDW5536795.1 heavy metal translocating P-type ATPase [Azospirillum sp. NL1]